MEGRSSIGGRSLVGNVTCSTEDFTCYISAEGSWSIIIDSVICSAIGRSDCSSTVCSAVVCSGCSLIVCFVACSIVGYSSFSALEKAGVIVVWIDGEEILLKMLA